MTKFILFLFICTLFFACTEPAENKEKKNRNEHGVQTIPQISMSKEELQFDKQNSLWYQGDQLFSGYIISKYENDSLMRKIGIFNGKKQGPTTDWYVNGKVKSVTNYKAGKLHGIKKVWHQDDAHTLLAKHNFVNGKAEGEQRKWYPTGELYQILHMKEGREEGIQQAFRKNGDLYANYEAKNGRIFGMKKAALCFGLEDQKIKYED